MELEQLVSFVRYQRGQKQGWDALDEVLTIVLESKERVAAGEALVAKHMKDIEEMKGSLAALEETRQAKLKDLDDELKKRVNDFETPLKTAKDALQREIDDLAVVKAAMQAEAEATVQRVEAEKANLAAVLDHKEIAERDLARLKQAIADLKASL